MPPHPKLLSFVSGKIQHASERKEEVEESKKHFRFFHHLIEVIY